MKLYLVILLVPLVFATKPLSRGKIIYSNGDILGEFANQPYPPSFNYYNLDDSLANFYIEAGWGLPLDMTVNITGKEDMSFVVELVEQSGMKTFYMETGTCENNSSSELRPLIDQCEGELFLRELSAEEISQMEAFKANVKETGRDVYMFYEKNLQFFQAAQLKEFVIEAKPDRIQPTLKIAAYRDPAVSSKGNGRLGNRLGNRSTKRVVPGYGEVVMNVVFHDYKKKRFAVQVSSNDMSNCDRPPVPGLRTTDCHGSVKITDGSEGIPAPGNPESSNQMGGKRDIPLDDLSPEELKRLLKGILERL